MGHRSEEAEIVEVLEQLKDQSFAERTVSGMRKYFSLKNARTS